MHQSLHLSFFNNSEFQWFFTKVINFYLMTHSYLLKDNEDSSHHRTVICIILYSGNCLLCIRIFHIILKMSQKKSPQRFLNVPHIQLYMSLGEPLPLEITVKIYQVINWLKYFLVRIWQVNWDRRNREGWTANAYILGKVHVLVYLNITFCIFPIIKSGKFCYNKNVDHRF